MNSWKEERKEYLKKLHEANNEGTPVGVPFTWYVTTGPGAIRVEKGYELVLNIFIGSRTKKVIETAIKADSDVSKGSGLAKYVDEKYKPYIDSIIFKEIIEGEIRDKGKSYEFIPYTRFIVKGVLPENIEEFKKYLCDFIQGQCGDGWGEGFEQDALPGRGPEKYYSTFVNKFESGIDPETWVTTKIY